MSSSSFIIVVCLKRVSCGRSLASSWHGRSSRTAPQNPSPNPDILAVLSDASHILVYCSRIVRRRGRISIDCVKGCSCIVLFLSSPDIIRLQRCFVKAFCIRKSVHVLLELGHVWVFLQTPRFLGFNPIPSFKGARPELAPRRQMDEIHRTRPIVEERIEHPTLFFGVKLLTKDSLDSGKRSANKDGNQLVGSVNAFSDQPWSARRVSLLSDAGGDCFQPCAIGFIESAMRSNDQVGA